MTTPHHVRPDHYPLPTGKRSDGIGHDGASLARRPRQSTAPAGLWAPAPEVIAEKATKARKAKVKATPQRKAPVPGELRSATGRAIAPCGTDSAYKRHIRNGEKACRPCMDEHSRVGALYDRNRGPRKVYTREHCGSEAGIAEHTRRRERQCDACRNVTDRKRHNEEKAA